MGNSWEDLYSMYNGKKVLDIHAHVSAPTRLGHSVHAHGVEHGDEEPTF